MQSLLADTHAVLWFMGGNESLSATARAALKTSDNRVFVSIASIWEIAIKNAKGRLQLSNGLQGFLADISAYTHWQFLPIELAHLLIVNTLAPASKPSGDRHGDPFDRLLVAQAMSERLTIVTNEQWWAGTYGVNVLW